MHEDVREILDSLKIKVEHAAGTENVCPNSIIGCAIWAVTGEEPEWRGRRNGFLEGSALFNPIALKPMPDAVSVISGEPAVVYKAEDYAIPMTVAELLRFIRHDLRPDEFKVLLAKYGPIHEIHDDFYDPRTGDAWQPILRKEAAKMEGGQPKP
jgi:hypothetical protein